MEAIKSFFKKFPHTDNGNKILASVFSIMTGIFFGFLLMLVLFGVGDAFEGLWIIISSGFGEGLSSMLEVLYYATPIILTGLSVGFAFKTGLFNIGATGQLTMGGIVAIYVGVNWTFLPGHLHWIVAVILATLVGGLWGLIPGVLKAFLNVHEVVATIMLNYTALYFTSRIVGTVLNDGLGDTRPIVANARLPQLGLDRLVSDTRLDSGILLAILAVVIIYIVLEKTTFGFQLKAVGLNKDAAKYAGINEKMNIVYSMIIAGMLAGLAGATLFLSVADKNMNVAYVLIPEGFDGIAVALLGLSHPIGVLFSGIFFGFLKVSEAELIQSTLPFKEEMIQIIISVIIYLSALALIFRKFVKNIFTKDFWRNVKAKLQKLFGKKDKDLAVPQEGGDE